MSIMTRCPECDMKYRVKDELRGKRFICKVCKAAVPVGEETPRDEVEPKPNLDQLFDDSDDETESSLETSTDLKLYGDTQEELVLKRTLFQASSYGDDQTPVRMRGGSGTWLQRVSFRLAQSPWGLPQAFFIGCWVPLSFLELDFAWVMNVILMSLCILGFVVVKILEALEIPFPNPLDVLTDTSVGAIAGISPRKRPRNSGYLFATQLLIILGALLAHTLVLSAVDAYLNHMAPPNTMVSPPTQ